MGKQTNLLSFFGKKRKKKDEVDLPVKRRKLNSGQKWSCSACTFLNHSEKQKCEICGQKKGALPKIATKKEDESCFAEIGDSLALRHPSDMGANKPNLSEVYPEEDSSPKLQTIFSSKVLSSAQKKKKNPSIKASFDIKIDPYSSENSSSSKTSVKKIKKSFVNKSEPDATIDLDFSVPLSETPAWIPNQDGASHWRNVCFALKQLTSTTKRIAKLTILTQLFASFLRNESCDLGKCVSLLIGRLAPPWEGVTTKIGSSTVAKVAMQKLGISKSSMSSLYKKYGDLGDVVEKRWLGKSPFGLKPKSLTVNSVFDELRGLCELSGSGSQNKRKGIILKLFNSCTSGVEMKFLVRMLINNTRIGATEISICVALARAIVLHTEKLSEEEQSKRFTEMEARVRKSWHLCPDPMRLCKEIFTLRTSALSLNLGFPCQPMLAHPANASSVVIQKLGLPIRCEFKYDGMRAQVHVQGDVVKIFSRDCQDTKQRFSSLYPSLRRAFGSSAILDGEVCATDSKTGKILPFQILSTTAKKDSSKSRSFNLCFFVFDILHLNGKDLIDHSLQQRLDILQQTCKVVKDEVELVSSKLCTTEGEVDEYLSFSRQSGCEGLMCKKLDSIYTCNRSNDWLKLKFDYTDMADSLDVIPVGAWWGNGRKAGWFSPFLLAVYNQETESYQSLCRCMSGFTDEFYKAATEKYKKHVIESKHPLVETNEVCSVWFDIDKSDVWEIRGAEFSVSKKHRVANEQIDGDGGLALRFPRFLRERPDKSNEETTEIDTILSLYQAQHR